MNAIETSGTQTSAVDSAAPNVSCAEPVSRLPPPDAFAAEKFSSAMNRHAPLAGDAGLRDGHLFDLLADLRWPDSAPGQAQSVNDATLLQAPSSDGEACCSAAPQLLADAEPVLLQTLRGQNLPAQDCADDVVLQTKVTLQPERKIGRKSNDLDDDRASDALQSIVPPSIPHLTPHFPAAVDPSAAQAAYTDPARSELRMQEFHHLVSQMGAQVAIDSRRSEVAVSLSHAMFSSTRLRIRGDKDSIEVGYECGSAEETDWFGSNAEALVQRLSTSLQRRVTIRPVADQSAM